MPFFSHRSKQTFSKNVNKDVLLCATTNSRAERSAANALIRDSISFSKRWRTIPLMQRNAYQGARQICEISINRNEYSRARRILETLPEACQNRLYLHVL